MDRIQHKISKPFAYKSQGNTVKDVDTASRTVVFYSNSFDKMDDQLDIIRKGAFAKSINEWGPQSSGNRKVKHCLFHDETKLPGAIAELSEDNYGLRVAVKMSDTQLGNDTLQYYQDGVYSEHSIRIGYVKDRIKWVEDPSLESGGYFEVTAVKLWHTATVPFGSNEHTPVVGFKSITTDQERTDAIAQLNERFNTLTKALRNGKYSEEAFKDLAYHLTECQDAYNSLITTTQDKSTLIEDAQNNNASKEVFTILSSFSIK